MERGWDPEIRKYFKKVLFSVCYGLIWMLTMVTLGLYYQLAYSAGKPIIYTILFYASMGKLTFDLITIKKLSPNYFQVVGKWSLERTIGNVDGHFTLLLRKIKGEWVIISDHSS